MSFIVPKKTGEICPMSCGGIIVTDGVYNWCRDCNYEKKIEQPLTKKKVILKRREN
jgi:hypothetical protein